MTNPIPGTIRIVDRAGVRRARGRALRARRASSTSRSRASSSPVRSSGRCSPASRSCRSPSIPLFWCPVFGLLGGILAGVGVAAMLAFFSLRYHVDQVVVGVVLVAFGYGITSFLLGQIPDDREEQFNNPQLLEAVEIPGPPQDPLHRRGALRAEPARLHRLRLVPLIVWFLLFQTRWGLRVRSVGEHPKAADTVGIDPNRTRWQAVLLGGVFAGLGGASFTLSTGAFDKEMTAGLGFIALAAVIMGRWHPVYAAFAARDVRLPAQPQGPAEHPRREGARRPARRRCPTSRRSSRSRASSAGCAHRRPTGSPTRSRTEDAG